MQYRIRGCFYFQFAVVYLLKLSACFADDVLTRVDQFAGPSAFVAAQASTIDSERNIISVWRLDNTADFNPRNGAALLASDDGSVVVTKLDRKGKLKWFAQFGTKRFYTGAVYPSAVTTDTFGNILIVGQFFGTADFDPGEADYFLTNADNTFGGFIVKLNSAGQLVWAGHFPCTENASITGVVARYNEYIVVSGSHTGTMDYDPTAATTSEIVSAGGSDGFLIQLLSDGRKGYAALIRDNGYESCISICQDPSGNIYYVGTFGYYAQTGNVDFDPSGGTSVLGGLASTNIYIVKLTHDRQFIWAKQFDNHGSSNTSPRVTTDAAGNVFVTGRYSATCDFDPGAGVYDIDPGGPAVFLAKLNTNGDFLWAKSIPGNDISPASVTTDKDGRVYTSLQFDTLGKSLSNSSVAQDPGKIRIHYKAYFEKRKPNGKLIWSGTIGDGIAYLEYWTLAVDKRFKVYAIGSLEKNTDMEPGESEAEYTADGDRDGMILRLNIPRK